MKKIAVLLVVIFTLTSCSEDLVFNDPAFIGYNDGELWEAASFRANVDGSGHLTITGIRNSETINLKTTNTVEDIYVLGNTTSSATYEDEFGTVYTTNNTPNPNTQVYPAEGEIIISEYNLIEKTVSGTFFFYAYDSSGQNSENFNRGYFYHVPILSIGVSGNVDVTAACQNATAVVVTTQTNYNNVDPMAPEYTQICNFYKTALQGKKQQCGDPDGAIQDIIDALGDCTN